MQVISREALASILGISANTITIWLDGYRFTKYRILRSTKPRKIVFPFTKEFISVLSEYLETTRHEKELENLKRFVKNGVRV